MIDASYVVFQRDFLLETTVCKYVQYMYRDCHRIGGLLWISGTFI
jgi:hypothetical protein